MEDLNPPCQIGKKPRAAHDVETMPAGSVLESLGAQRFAKESTTTAGGVEGGEQLAMMADESAATLGAMAGVTGSLEAEAGVADVMPKSRAERLVVPEEQAALPKTSEGVVGHAVWPPSSQVAPLAAEEEDEVEEIEREES